MDKIDDKDVKDTLLDDMVDDENDKEFRKYSYILDDDLVFPKASVDPKLLRLQKDVTEFVTSVVLKHEKEFYNLVKTHFHDQMEYLLGSTCSSIIEMITSTTNKFYNGIYRDIQNAVVPSNKQNLSQLAKLILEMCKCAEYGPHILLDKLIRLTIELHIDINREQLAIENDDYELYEKSVLGQINIYLLSCNLLHILSKGEDDDEPFIPIPDGKNAFNIKIDKNIER
ncbi:MAG: hypothetical protein Satyrvirus26_8 [Satyrvirus sp.]|uniref:Uncharacterized protein n=1 Tax=Satyrvirus sp. TaxID=2487771 RepID=A0A3G5AJF0_9VIRU|nr:MAG: hypothetical protein Satyrvirus26_8 [Satyrvirus sp.]